MSKLSEVYSIEGFVLDVDGVLSSTVLQISEEGQPIRTTNLHDGFAIRVALRAGFKMAVITGGKCENVKKRYNLLGISDVYIGVTDKMEVFDNWLRKSEISAEQIAYMGDDIPDLGIMRCVGLPSAPYDARPEVLQTAKFISKCGGGYGCVRDLIESVMRAQGLWDKYAY
ncbi:MAG: 3-deoxy-D-manno-octulosonate 8-phosphate phosphatase [Muribaculaceae bacterium]|nr:3-deoxy-D-manno-octulosonate 8-phosphate phosphatase [Muribaculaceae bacterium]